MFDMCSQEPASDEASSEEDPEVSYRALRRGVERMNSECTLRNRKSSHHYKKHYTVEVWAYTLRHSVFTDTNKNSFRESS